jgi:hypothetical protein
MQTRYNVVHAELHLAKWLLYPSHFLFDLYAKR